MMANITREQFEEWLNSGNTDLRLWLNKYPDLTGLDLRNLDLSRGMLNLGRRLRRVDFRGCRFREGEDWSGGHNFSITDMRKANLEGVSLIGVNASDSNWTGVILNKANLSWGMFIDCILSGAKLRGATLVQSDFNTAFLDGADFSGAILTRTGIHAADLTGADFSGIRATRTSIGGGANLCFDDAQLAGVSFSYQYLAGASFRGADLQGADLQSTNLKGADFTGAKINWRTNLDGAAVDDSTIWNVAKGGVALLGKQQKFRQEWYFEEKRPREVLEAQPRRADLLEELATIYQDRE